ncbi:unnamed protein product [Diplocarpon coronariae]
MAASFTITQPFLGAPLQFQPDLGSKELEALVDAYVSGHGSKQEKFSVVTVEFFNHATVDLNTGALTRTYDVYIAPIFDHSPMESQSSGHSPTIFTPSPGSSTTLGDSGYGSFGMPTPSVTPRTRTLGSARLVKRAAKRDSKTKMPKVEETRLPGFSIMTKDGIDVTTTAGRGTKTREQREHAHLMRILKACDACKRKKIRCDPSHRTSHNLSRTSSTTMTSSASAGPRSQYEGNGNLPGLTRQSTQASQGTPFTPLNAIDDFVLFPEDASWNPEMSQADLGSFNFDLADTDWKMGSEFDLSFGGRQQPFVGNLDIDPQLVHSFNQQPHSSAGQQNITSIPHTIGSYPVPAERFDLDQYLVPNQRAPVYIGPHSAAQHQEFFQQSSMSPGPSGDLIPSTSDWSLLESTLQDSPGGGANLSSPMRPPSSQTSSGGIQQRVSRNQEAVMTRGKSTAMHASGSGSRSGTVVDPPDNLDVPPASKQRRALAVHWGGSSSFAGGLSTLAQECHTVSERLRAIKSSGSENTALVKELQSLRSVARFLRTGGTTVPMSTRAEVQVYQAQLQNLSTRLLEPCSGSRPAANPLLNTLDPDFYPEFLRQCQVQARRLVSSLCATVNTSQVQSTGTHSPMNAGPLMPGPRLQLFSPSLSQEMEHASLISGDIWVDSAMGCQTCNGASIMETSSGSARGDGVARSHPSHSCIGNGLFSRRSQGEELGRGTSCMQEVFGSSLSVEEPRVDLDQAGSPNKFALPLPLTSQPDALPLQIEQLGRNLDIQVNSAVDSYNVPASRRKSSHRNAQFFAGHASIEEVLQVQSSTERSPSTTLQTPTDNGTGVPDLTESHCLASSVIRLLAVMAVLAVIGSFFSCLKIFTSDTLPALSVLQVPGHLRGSCHEWVGTDPSVSVAKLLLCAPMVTQSPSHGDMLRYEEHSRAKSDQRGEIHAEKQQAVVVAAKRIPPRDDSSVIRDRELRRELQLGC